MSCQFGSNNRGGHLGTPNSSFRWLHFCSWMSYPFVYRSVWVIRATTLFNFQRNNFALQVEEKCCPYYRPLGTPCSYMNLAERFLNYALMIFIQLSNSHGKSANYISVSIDGDALTTCFYTPTDSHSWWNLRLCVGNSSVDMIYIIRPKPGPVAKNATPRPSGWESNPRPLDY